MASFAGHPETYDFENLHFERGRLGVYTVTLGADGMEVATVSPYGDSDWGWLHLETGRSGHVTELAAAGNEIHWIEKSRQP